VIIQNLISFYVTSVMTPR